ncbi:hypothetical protein DW083_02895 [Parabacteroides sp. AF48-14]|uniref:DUF6807 family protein n=1 Tax=Parabacteroides sp. AF48-14 TaxID=2292052 RepID=UPI000EFEED7F|nr:DUF6807 family protein [Parabacteroides sp. AF48-14]RHO74663.1 hypothetical protein DW083_02895 [Parabacteroides sp. AF48-14]
MELLLVGFMSQDNVAIEDVRVCCFRHPENYNAPEPLRIWDENANGGRGDAFVNFAPTKNKDWKLMPGEHYKLCYRIFSYDGEMTRERADRLWNDFAYPPKVTIKQ